MPVLVKRLALGAEAGRRKLVAATVYQKHSTLLNRKDDV